MVSKKEKLEIVKKLREYQKHGTTVKVAGIEIPDVYRWDDILSIILGKGYCYTTYEAIDRIMELIEPDE